jgi:hypothetical protein
MRVFNHKAKQVHPVPDRIMDPKGPFPKELFAEPEIIVDNYDTSEYGGDYALGATAQNNYRPPKYLRCSVCMVRVLEEETEYHVCEE